MSLGNCAGAEDSPLGQHPQYDGVVPDYPTLVFPPDIIGVLCSYFTDGRGPTHARLASAIAEAGIDEVDLAFGNKEDRLRAAFRASSGDVSYQLAEQILGLLRNDDAFGRRPSNVAWATRARAAFARVGWSIDEHGYPEWYLDAPSSTSAAGSLFVPRQSATAMAAQAIRTINSAASSENGGSLNGNSGVRVTSTNIDRQRSAFEESTMNSAQTISSNAPQKIFLVHGHDEAARHAVESFVSRTTGIIPTVLMLEASSGMTVIEKFEQYADNSSYAIVLMTPDDLGQSNAEAERGASLRPRARQNVIFELGYFVSFVRRSHVAALVSPNVERPSDIAGVVFIEFVAGSAEWRETLRREMAAAGLPIVN